MVSANMFGKTNSMQKKDSNIDNIIPKLKLYLQKQP